jgi:hypothetical protein
MAARVDHLARSGAATLTGGDPNGDHRRQFATGDIGGRAGLRSRDRVLRRRLAIKRDYKRRDAEANGDNGGCPAD